MSGFKPTRSILAANPSFQHPLEQRFWDRLQRSLERHGWSLFLHSARRIDDAENRIVIPARLSHLPRFFSQLPFAGHEDTPPWLDGETVRSIVEWEHRRWSLPMRDYLVDGGLRRLAWHVDSLVHAVNPALVMSTNKIDHGCYLFYLAAKYYGIAYRFIERSPLDSILVEERGMFAESAIFSEYNRLDHGAEAEFVPRGMAIREQLSHNAEGFREQDPLDEAAVRLLAERRRPLIMLPLDSTLWTGWAMAGHPQAAVDYPPEFADVRETINWIAAEVDRIGGTLLLKLHPADCEIYFDRQNPCPKNVEIISFGLNDLMRMVDGCICFLTKTAFPSICSGLPTAVVSTNTASLLAGGVPFTTKRELARFIGDFANLRPGGDERTVRQQATLLGWLAKRYYVDVSSPVDFTSRPVSALADALVLSGETEVSPHLLPSGIALRRWGQLKSNIQRKSLGQWSPAHV